jgi:hypothetical protein
MGGDEDTARKLSSMNHIRREMERLHEEHVAAQGEQKPKKWSIREWFRRQWLRRTSSSR